MRRRLLFAQAIAALATVGCGAVSCGVMDWSPDRRYVVTVWPSAAGPTVLRLVDVETGRGRVIAGSSDAVSPLWSPDQSALVFAKARGGNGPDVYIHDPASASTRLLRANALPVVWREDSARLLTVGPESHAVCLTMPDGHPTWEARLPADVSGTIEGSWVPDTDQVVLRIGGDLWLIEGAEPVKLTTTADVLGFALRGGGKEVIWARKSHDSRYILLSLYALPLKQRGSRRLPFPHRVAQISPSPRSGLSAIGDVVFAPNGERMVVSCRFDVGGKTAVRWYSMASDGSDARLLTRTDLGNTPRRPSRAKDLGEALVTAMGEAWPLVVAQGLSPRFSHDGRRLALLVEGRKGRNEASLVVCNADRTGCRVVCRTGRESQPRRAARRRRP